MFENYFNNQEPIKNQEDLNNILFKELITESFMDNEIRFDKILKKIIENNISLFERFTIHPEYTGEQSNNEIIIERNNSDYSSFLIATTQFINNEKYILKLLDYLNKEDVKKNQQEFMVFIFGLFDNNFKECFKKIIDNNWFTEKEIKLNLILPENPYYYHVRNKKIHEFEIDFLSENIHELKVNNRNSFRLVEIYDFILKNSNKEQYYKLTKTIRTKVDFSKILEKREDIFKKLLDFGIINTNEVVGNKFIEDKEKNLEIKSFLRLSENKILQITQNQALNLQNILSKNNKNENKKTIKI